MGTSAALEAHEGDPETSDALRVAAQMMGATRKVLRALELHRDAAAADPKFLTFLHLQVSSAHDAGRSQGLGSMLWDCVDELLPRDWVGWFWCVWYR